METIRGNTLEYWKQNAEENYITTPISVLKYITILEELNQVNKISSNPVLCDSVFPSYEYEMFFNSEPDDPMQIHGWYPIATDTIRKPEKIDHYIETGLLRRITNGKTVAFSSSAYNEFINQKIKNNVDKNDYKKI